MTTPNGMEPADEKWEAEQQQRLNDGRRFQKLLSMCYENQAGVAILVAPAGHSKEEVEKAVRDWVDERRM